MKPDPIALVRVAGSQSELVCPNCAASGIVTRAIVMSEGLSSEFALGCSTCFEIEVISIDRMDLVNRWWIGSQKEEIVVNLENN